MKKRAVCIIIILTFVYNFIRAQESNVVPGNIIVMVNSDTDVEKLSNDLQFVNEIKTDFKMERILSKSMHIYLFDFNSVAIENDKMLEAVRQNHLVKIAQFNHTFKERAIPNDPQFGVMWDMKNTGQSGGTPLSDIQATQAWDITTGGLTSQGDTIVAAIIDGIVFLPFSFVSLAVDFTLVTDLSFVSLSISLVMVFFLSHLSVVIVLVVIPRS